MTVIGLKYSHLLHWILKLYNHLNIDISRVVSSKKDVRRVYSQMASVETKISGTYINGW